MLEELQPVNLTVVPFKKSDLIEHIVASHVLGSVLESMLKEFQSDHKTSLENTLQVMLRVGRIMYSRSFEMLP